MNTDWHFPIMILTSVLVFTAIIRFVLGRGHFYRKWRIIAGLAVLVVIGGMLIGRYGALWGLPWWIYYPVPMLMNVLMPPVALKMDRRKTVLYLVLSFLSAPLIHIFFSLALGWNEYMPFWTV